MRAAIVCLCAQAALWPWSARAQNAAESPAPPVIRPLPRPSVGDGMGTRLAWQKLSAHVAEVPASSTGSPHSKSRKPSPTAKRARPRLLWTGFRPARGETPAEIWVQTSGALPFAVQGTKTFATLRLTGCRQTLRRTDRLPLETRFFDSPASRVAVRQSGRDIEVHIQLRRPASAQARQEAGPDGSWFYVVSLLPPLPTGALATASESAGDRAVGAGRLSKGLPATTTAATP